MIKKFLNRLQNSDEETKKRWMILFVSILAILVVVVWIKYVNFVTKPVIGSGEGEGEISFAETMKNGVGVIYQKIVNVISDAGNLIKNPKEYFIKPENN